MIARRGITRVRALGALGVLTAGLLYGIVDCGSAAAQISTSRTGQQSMAVVQPTAPAHGKGR